MLRRQPRIAESGIAEQAAEICAEAFIERGRAVAPASVRANLGASAMEEPGRGGVAGLRSRRRSKLEPGIRSRRRRSEPRLIQRKKLGAIRTGKLKAIAQERNLVLDEYRMTSLAHLDRGIVGRSWHQSMIPVLLIFELVAAVNQLVPSYAPVHPADGSMNIAIIEGGFAAGRLEKSGSRRAIAQPAPRHQALIPGRERHRFIRMNTCREGA